MRLLKSNAKIIFLFFNKLCSPYFVMENFSEAKQFKTISCRLAWVPPGNLLFPVSEAKNGLINCEKE